MPSVAAKRKIAVAVGAVTDVVDPIPRVAGLVRTWHETQTAGVDFRLGRYAPQRGAADPAIAVEVLKRAIAFELLHEYVEVIGVDAIGRDDGSPPT